MSWLVKNFNMGIFSGTINVINVKLLWWYLPLSFTCSLHFQWPWHYFKVTTVSSIFNWEFFVLIQLSWNFVGVLSTSSRSWICHSRLLSRICAHLRQVIDIFLALTKTLLFIYFTDTVQMMIFNLCIIVTLLGVYQFISGFTFLTLFPVTGVSES